MGYYVNEEYVPLDGLPVRYGRVICRTCIHKDFLEKNPNRPVNEEYTINIGEYIHKPKICVSRQVFENEHVGHRIDSTCNSKHWKNEINWTKWRFLTEFCSECQKFIPICCMCPERNSVSFGICSKCGFDTTSREWGERKCDHIQTKKQYFSCPHTPIEHFYCNICRAFLSEKEIWDAVDAGRPKSMSHVSDWTSDDSVYVFHFARCHKKWRKEIKIGYEEYTPVKNIRRDYGLKMANVYVMKKQTDEPESETV